MIKTVSLLQPKKKKNISHDAFGTKFGQVHMQKQDLSKLQTRKMKGLRKRGGEVVSEDQDGQTSKVAKVESWGGSLSSQCQFSVHHTHGLSPCSKDWPCAHYHCQLLLPWMSMWAASRRSGCRAVNSAPIVPPPITFPCDFQALLCLTALVKPHKRKKKTTSNPTSVVYYLQLWRSPWFLM